ncbi:MAG: ABC transporter substrate-binding protein [Hyphomicrobiaceae bacterium]
MVLHRKRKNASAPIRHACLVLLCAGLTVVPAIVAAADVNEIPSLQADVRSGALPAMSKRLPVKPYVVDFAGNGLKSGHYGGTWSMLLGRAKDIRLMSVYGYARLIGYNKKLALHPDILKNVEVTEGRVFTLHLRKGHRWSDGFPFSAEDFRYYWEDIALNEVLQPLGPPATLLVNGQPPRFEVIDPTTVRFSWAAPNPYFLPSLAGASPLYIYRPAHYLKQFHAKYQGKAKLDAMVKAESRRDWRALHFAKDRMYRADNVDLPTLQPWVNTTKPPAERFIFKRNPYYHRVDDQGRQLPYIDNVVAQIASAALIPAKVGTGESDLQARSLEFKNFTFLKAGEKRNNYKVLLWKTGKGSQLALYPNLNVKDPVWRDLLRNPDVRRALSLAIDRGEINEAIFFGFGLEGNNTVLPDSPLYRDEYREKWATFDLDKANALLDKAGLDKRNSDDLRLLPDGRTMEIIVETAGEDSERADVLQLITDTWKKAGIKLFIKPTRRETLRKRVLSGETVMSVFFGIDNGLATPATAPTEMVPSDDTDLQWPKWGTYTMTSGQSGEEPDIDAVNELLSLYKSWDKATDDDGRSEIWHKILQIHADNVFSIGIVAAVPQPVVVRTSMQNVPKVGLYNWDPGAHFGIHHPDAFWIKTK